MVFGIVIIWFVVCWVFVVYFYVKELFLIVIIVYFDLKIIMNLLWLLLLVYLGLNFIVYGFVKRDIKKELIKFFNC